MIPQTKGGPYVGITRKELAKMIDWATGKMVQGRYYTRGDVKKICDIAKKYGFGMIFIPTSLRLYAAELLKGTDVKLSGFVGGKVSWGQETTETKVFIAVDSIKNGAKELDMQMNLGAFKDGDYDFVRRDIEAVVRAVGGKLIKVIVETPWLTDEQIVRASKIVEDAGASYVKTSIGFGNITTLHHVKLIRETISKDMGIKVSGGVSTTEQALAFIKAGANKIGTSAAVEIVEGLKEEAD